MINAWCCANASFNAEPFVKINGLDGIYNITDSGGMPPGLSLIQDGPTSATINETATTPGNYQFTVVAKNKKTGLSNSSVVSFNVLGFTNNPSLGTIAIGANFQMQLNAQGSSGNLSYAMDNLNSPSWMNLNSVTGLLYGTPLCPNHGQHSQFSVSVTDQATNGTCAMNLDLTVGSAPVFTVTPLTCINGIVGQAYGQNFATTGGTGPFVFTCTDPADLPNGLIVFNGALQGTPTTAGNYSFNIQAVDKFNCVGSSTVTIHIGTLGNSAVTVSCAGGQSITIPANTYVNYPGGPYAGLSQGSLNSLAYQAGDASLSYCMCSPNIQGTPGTNSQYFSSLNGHCTDGFYMWPIGRDFDNLGWPNLTAQPNLTIESWLQQLTSDYNPKHGTWYLGWAVRPGSDPSSPPFLVLHID